MRDEKIQAMLHYLIFPNSPPNKLVPPPPPPIPRLLASVLIYSFIHPLSPIFLTSTTFVSVCASPLSKLSSVGMLVIIYSIPNPLTMISGASYSTSQNETPPSASPTPDSSRSWMTGGTVLQVLQLDAVHRVNSKVREEVERRRLVEKSSGRRTLLVVRN
jgi:hypothetical protein